MTREPTDDRKSDTMGLRLAVFLIVCLLGVYLAGYIFGSDGGDTVPGLTGRRFSSVSVARLYTPLAWLEAKLTNKAVHLWVNEPPHAADDYSYLANP